MRCARANQLFALAALGLAHAGSASASLVNGLFRGASSGVDGFVEPHRGDASTSRQLQNYYFSTTELGAVNPNAAMGNPLRGLYTSPRWTNFNTPDAVPDSIDFYYIGLDEVMKSNTVFNWTALDDSIAAAVARNKHVAWRIICHYPGEPLRVPKYLVDAGIALVPTAADGISPQYDDPRLLEAFRLFIAAFGGRYDGNKAVAFIQLGLLGKWGEWHTFPENNLISTATRNQVIAWYSAAFTRTSLMARGPMDTAIAQGHGLHDDSFGYSTIGVVDYFFWPSVSRGGHTNFWRKGMMSGETRPELQGSIFEPTYRAGVDPYKQDFQKCVNTTRASSIFHHHCFENQISGPELANARTAHVNMGYNFIISRVGALAVNGNVNLDVTVTQIGIAPFYYPLSLVVSCPSGSSSTSKSASGVEQLIDVGASRVFTVTGFPATSACLGSLSISLQSNFTQTGRPIKFAQGTDGKVSVRVPLPPPTVPTTPVRSPVVGSAPVIGLAPSAVGQPPVPTNSSPRPGLLRRIFNFLFGWLF